MYLRLGLNKIFILLNLVPGKFGMICFWNTVPLFPLDEYLLKLIHKIKELDLYMKYLHCSYFRLFSLVFFLLENNDNNFIITYLLNFKSSCESQYTDVFTYMIRNH